MAEGLRINRIISGIKSEGDLTDPNPKEVPSPTSKSDGMCSKFGEICGHVAHSDIMYNVNPVDNPDQGGFTDPERRSQGVNTTWGAQHGRTDYGEDEPMDELFGALRSDQKYFLEPATDNVGMSVRNDGKYTPEPGRFSMTRPDFIGNTPDNIPIITASPRTLQEKGTQMKSKSIQKEASHKTPKIESQTEVKSWGKEHKSSKARLKLSLDDILNFSILSDEKYSDKISPRKTKSASKSSRKRNKDGKDMVKITVRPTGVPVTHTVDLMDEIITSYSRFTLDRPSSKKNRHKHYGVFLEECKHITSKKKPRGKHGRDHTIPSIPSTQSTTCDFPLGYYENEINHKGKGGAGIPPSVLYGDQGVETVMRRLMHKHKIGKHYGHGRGHHRHRSPGSPHRKHRKKKVKILLITLN